ncbi:hypothetical protein [Mesorhizobium sp. B2-4-6]|uniref:hypothetical protein n=1 Tax=Mesorhizobium sp. B2-4-6 TaxID=2589943 RepID=UPI001126B908|nr:hypothetical protein [Mesorhizobium sp. B2-4-6]TPL40701.1 hypothetical protein FJ957_26075 [Mesorhizobium sp. B2-4-6]
MADETHTVVTELTIDARGAEAGSAAYIRAHKAAQAAVDRTIERERAATEAIERQGAVMLASSGSITSTSRAWDRLRASVDPSVRSAQLMERAIVTADSAAKKLGVDSAEVARVLGLAKLQHDATAAAAEKQAASYRELAAAGREALAAEQAQANINRTLGVGGAPVASARASASVFSTELDRIDEIAAQRAAQAGQIFAADLENSMVAGVSKSARESASVFGAELDRMETIAQQKAAQIGAAFQADLNASFGIGAAGGSARASASTFEETARAEDALAAKAALLRAEINPLGAAQRQLNDELEQYATLAAKGAISTEELAAAQALAQTRFNQTAAQIAASGKLASFEMRNLKFQLIDIAQSIPLAFQSPLYFLQNLGFQFAQIGQIFMGNGGIRAALAAVGGVLSGVLSMLAHFAAPLTAIALGFNYVRDAAADAERRTVGWGETFVATYQVIRDGLKDIFGPAATTLADPVIYALKQLASAAVDIAELIINSFHAVFFDIKAVWAALPDAIGLVFAKAANFGIETLNLLIKKSSDAVDTIIAAFNKLGAGIEPINAKAETIPPIDERPYIASLNKLVTDRNAAIEEIMKATPIRDFGQAIVDKIQTNHALEGLDALANVDFGKSIGGVNALGAGLGAVGKQADGVKVEFGGMVQQAINVTKLFDDAKRQQLIGLEQTQQQLIGMKHDAAELQKTLEAAAHAPVKDVFGSIFDGAGGEAAIANAVSTVDKLFKAWDDGRQTVSGVHDGIEMVRQSLIQMGGDTQSIDAFVNKIVNGQLLVRQLASNVDSLSRTIRAIPNRTVTITVVTRQVGSGTQSLYDVPNSSGGTSTVGVTRYGGDGSTSGPSISSSSVPRTSGYGSMGGSGDLGSTTVNVTRFATGGVIHPGDSQHVQFFKSPDETVAILTPQQRTALADPQSAFTGRDATRDDDRIWQVLMNVEANTRKTYESVDKLVSSASYSASSSSYGGSGGSGADTSQQDQLSAQYMKVLQQVKANFQAAGIIGRGIIGYGLDGLAASPQEIARNLVYGGAQPLGAGGSTQYQRSVAQSSALDAYNTAQSIKAGGLGFDTGGQIAPGDTQKVEFFKNPNERVIIARPDQFEDRRSGAGSSQPVINQYYTNHFGAGATMSKDSLAEQRRQNALGTRDALRSVNGRG